MPKDIVLKNVPEDQYWEWKREKSDSEAHNWVEFFKMEIEQNNESDVNGD
jgi:hypothetical protein